MTFGTSGELSKLDFAVLEIAVLSLSLKRGILGHKLVSYISLSTIKR